MPMLDRPGGGIRYQVSGSGSPAVLLTHGFAATSAMFAANVPALAASHQVITWDLRGHGGSDYPADPAVLQPGRARSTTWPPCSRTVSATGPCSAATRLAATCRSTSRCSSRTGSPVSC